MAKLDLPNFSAADRYAPYQHQLDLIDTLVAGQRRKVNTLVEAPTGSGKSIVIADTAGVISQTSGLPVLVVVPNMDLALQNTIAMRRQFPDVSSTLCCSSLGYADLSGQMIVATAGSLVSKKLPALSAIIIDEAHRLPPWRDSQLQTVIRMAREKNPEILVHGATATPYRMDGDTLTDGTVWDGVAHRVDYLPLMKLGLLAPLIGPVGERVYELDISGISRMAGDYSEKEMNARFNNDPTTALMVDDMLRLGKDRKSWLTFCVSVEAAERMAEMLRSRGIDAVCVSGQTPRDERVKILDRFRAGDIRALCSMAILTTGFDAPNVDLLALCRPTSSVSLHVQILGRGSRPSSGKENALILDFARNVNRNGAINAPLFDFSSGRVASRPEPRQCEACGHFEAPQARVCSNCGESLVVEEHRERQAQLEEKADRNISPLAGVDDDVVDDDDDDWDFTPSIVQAQPTVFKVKSWSFDIHKKPGSPDSLKITYEVEGYRYRTCSAWLTAWHRSGAAWHGQQAWAALLKDNASRILPASAADAVVLAPKLLQRPDFVRITMDNGFPRVTPARDPASRAA